jgi:hypothetical protein
VSFLADSGPWPIGDLLFEASLKVTKNKTTLRSILPVPSPSCFLAPERFLETMPVTMKGSVPSPTKVLCAPTPSTPYLTGTKSPPPARRTPYHLDDPQYDAERIPQYLALQEEEPDEQEEEELVWLVVVLDEPVNMYVCDFWKKHSFFSCETRIFRDIEKTEVNVFFRWFFQMFFAIFGLIGFW